MWTKAEWAELEDRAMVLIEGGMSFSAVARELGIGRHAVGRLAARWGYESRRGTGGGIGNKRLPVNYCAVDSDAKSTGRRLSLVERSIIEHYRRLGSPAARIAEIIGYSASTVSREIAKNLTSNGEYFARRAQAAAEKARLRPRQRRLDADPVLRALVVSWLALKFSPAQVRMELIKRFPDDEEKRVSHETIYQALYLQGRGSLREELKIEWALRSGRTRRIPRSPLPRQSGKKTWVEGCLISTRPAEVADRAVPGHWEGDLLVGSKNQSAIITLVERTSRFILMRRLPADHEATTVTPLLVEMVNDLPKVLRRTLTWDQGTEMSRHADFTSATDMQVYFCDPRSPWQRGSNENANGLIREFFPKGTNFRRVHDDEIADAQYLLNIRPRATLGGLSPAEKFEQIRTDALTA